MRTNRSGASALSGALLLLAFPLLTGAKGGCGGEIAVGSGETGDAGVSGSSGSSSGSSSSGSSSGTASSGSSSGTGSSGSSSGTGSSGSSSGSASGTASSDGAACVVIETPQYDTSCKVDQDCVNVTVGEFCPGQLNCLCGNTSISASAEDQYNATIKLAGIGATACPCAAIAPPRCVTGVCTFCPDPGGCNDIGTGSVDGGVTESGVPDSGITVEPDGGRCIDIEASMYDTSCQVDSDCEIVTTGTFCDGDLDCLCGGAAINVDGDDQYRAALSNIQFSPPGCSCPALGAAHCIHPPFASPTGSCVYCPNPVLGGVVPTECVDAGI
jgi:hypothetical protein